MVLVERDEVGFSSLAKEFLEGPYSKTTVTDDLVFWASLLFVPLFAIFFLDATGDCVNSLLALLANRLSVFLFPNFLRVTDLLDSHARYNIARWFDDLTTKLLCREVG